MRMSRLRTMGAIALSAVIVVTGLQIAAAGTAGAATVSSTYSDPVWFPVRDAVQIACVGNGNQPKNNNYSSPGANCDGDHAKYFAINIDAVKGETAHPAVYAAGAGIVIVADSSPGTCGGSNHAGQTVEIDHGGGIVSVYEHLQTITVKKGAHVTPSTQLGTMGHSGQACTATVNYLDFQIQQYGAAHLNTDTVSIKTMRGCSGATEQTWPGDLGLAGNPTTWVQVPYKTHIDTGGGTCYPTSAGGSPAKPAKPTVAPLSGRATVSWSATGANESMIQLEIYRNGTGWEAPCSPYQSKNCTAGYTKVSGSTGKTTLTGLTNGRQYRLRVSRHNGNGWSPASSWVSLTEAPLFRKFRTTTSLVEIYWSMYRPTKLTTGKTEHFQIAVDTVKNGKAGAWTYYRTGGSATNFTVKTHRKTQYRMKVRALTNAGAGAWMKIHKVTTP
jgi:hypothetical protein